MRFHARDFFGIAVVAGAAGLVVVHQHDAHQRVHSVDSPAERALGNVAPVGVGVASGVTVFRDFTLATVDGQTEAEHQAVLIRDGEIAWIGPSSVAAIPVGARVVQGDGTQYLVAADRATRHGTLRTGDPADVLVLRDDPAARPEALDRPLCVMRQGVVLSLSPSLADDG